VCCLPHRTTPPSGDNELRSWRVAVLQRILSPLRSQVAHFYERFHYDRKSEVEGRSEDLICQKVLHRARSRSTASRNFHSIDASLLIGILRAGYPKEQSATIRERSRVLVGLLS